jgi:hypothetical protein
MSKGAQKRTFKIKLNGRLIRTITTGLDWQALVIRDGSGV